METLIKILEKIGESFVRVGWMFGMQVYLRPSSSSRLRQEGR